MNKFTLGGITAALTTFSTAAFAHHPMGGTTPATMGDGLLSGIGHPIIGLDHLAFVVAVGVAAALAGSRLLLPLAFIAATVLGTVVHIMSFNLPAVELVIAASVALIGVVVLSGYRVSLVALGGLFAAAGLFHGFAYGEAIFGAEATPLLSYLAGFGLTQYAIAVGAGTLVVSTLGKAAEWSANMPARIAGGVVAGAGGLLLSEHAMAALGFAA
ncbi:HupE/UreJ family protein [Pseudahrensia aquimaris]|uniref:HupE/UreJ family protein n=1 Tax=Pseudahrensia aquimaris TaxID=744461 RepID=A0ABW3FKE8_9HYPH